MFDIQKMMKQAQKMQDEMQAVQEQMANTEFTGSAGGGAVTITCNGKYEFKSVKFGADLDASDKDMLEDLMLTALQDLSKNVSTTMEAKISGVTQGLNIPGLKLPF